MAASLFISEALWLRTKPDVVEPIGPFIESLNLGLVIEVAEEAEPRANSWLSKSGRKKGTAFPAFDMFVVSLLVVSEQAGGSLDFKSRYLFPSGGGQIRDYTSNFSRLWFDGNSLSNHWIASDIYSPSNSEPGIFAQNSRFSRLRREFPVQTGLSATASTTTQFCTKPLSCGRWNSL
jgi:hypothetical protein